VVALWRAGCILLALLSGYILLVGLINRTALRVDAGRLATSHGPLPSVWPLRFHLQRARKLPLIDILETSVAEERGPRSRDSPKPRYRLTVLTIGSGWVELLRRLRLHEAQFLEQEIRGVVGLDSIAET
jgi:hypothetical protein